ncbi:MAG: GNAT family N-acetyltransferase [Chloroflexota bacterium]|nr:GNAT family N-acetyltransferase [Chloroflexota bacterium]
MLKEQTSPTYPHSIIDATQAIYDRLADFLNQNIKTHRHLDWFSSLEWVGRQPYLVSLEDGLIQAALCATPENKDSAWVRLYGVSKRLEEAGPWRQMLPMAVARLREMKVKQLAALALHPWFETLLVNSNFTNQQNIVVLEWQGQLPPKFRRNPDIEIRTMQFQDLPEVERIDKAAFPSLWQNSPAGLSKAFHQPGISTVAIKNDRIVGYQISTVMTIYGHLARLAVDPNHQREGIALALVYDLLQQFERRGFWRVTVNTQSNNRASLKLYQKFGFRRTSEEIKVYSLTL